MPDKKHIRVIKMFGFPYKHHKTWNILVETEDKEITTIRFKRQRSAKRFNKKYRKNGTENHFNSYY